MIQNKHKLAFLLCLLLMATTAFGASEAEYKKLAKTWTLNADGSQEFRYNMELTLFTHTAMNGTYGESFIVYNPQYQELKINSSYTRQKDGTIIKTPDNAFVEVLPRNAADAPAYNHLKEMVVVHTGLELGATIYLDYTVTSKPGYLPEVDIFEELLQSSPVKEYTLTIVTPETKELAYTLANNPAKASVKQADGTCTTSWTLRNLPASSRAPFVSVRNGDVPFLAATTYVSEGEALATLFKQFNPSGDPQLTTLAESLTEGKDQRAVGADILAREILHGTNTVGRTREFDHDILVQGRQRFPFADHTVEIGGDHLGAHIAIDDGADFEVMATAGLLTANVLLGHQRRIGRHPVEHTHFVSFPDLGQVSCIDKKFHSGKYLSNMKKQTNEPE